MKTLSELAKELRDAEQAMDDLPDVAGDRMIEAADRLERIESAWEELGSYGEPAEASLRELQAYRNLRSIIQGGGK